MRRTGRCRHVAGSRARRDARGQELPVPSKGVLVEREGAIMAATIEVPVSRPARPRHRRFPAPVAVGVAVVLAVTAALIFIAVARALAPPPIGPRTRTPAVG